MIKRIFAQLLTSFFFVGLFGTLPGCNTVAGIGQDIERGGQELKEEARERR